jgi:hypothetical protein
MRQLQLFVAGSYTSAVLGVCARGRGGGHLRLVTPEDGFGLWGTGLPAWQPLPER